MPYKIVEVQPNKYKVKKDALGRPKYFSKSPLSYDTALKQMKALYIHEHSKNNY